MIAITLSAVRGRQRLSDYVAMARPGHWAKNAWIRLSLTGGLAICVLATLGTAWRLRGYSYPHGWVSAHESVMAMQFARHGIVALGGVPIQNAGPMTASADAYLNWPPLYPMLLSWIVRFAGDGETVHHVTAALLVLATAAVLFAIVRQECGRLAALMASVGYLAAPVVGSYGQAGLHLHLAILATVGGLACFNRAIDGRNERCGVWLAATLICFYGATWTSWEPTLAAPGLLLVAALRRDRRGLGIALAVGIVAGLAVVSVFVLYGLSYPALLHGVFERALLRSGLAGAAPTALVLPPHALSDSLEPIGIPPWYPVLALLRFASAGLLGVGGLLATAVYSRSILRDKPALCYAIGGAASIAVLWSAGMANHMSIHAYEALIFVPPAALAAGALLEHLLRYAPARTLRWVPLAIVLALAGRAEATVKLLNENAHEKPLIQFGRAVGAATETNAVIVLPARNMMFVYYSQRHAIRGVMTEHVLDQERASIFALCPTCPVYLALPLARTPSFPGFAAQVPTRTLPGLGMLYRLLPGGG